MYRYSHFIYLCCFFAAGLAGHDAGAASFDCTRAAQSAEKLVCANKGLSTLDGALARLYAKRQEVVVDPAASAADQKAWLSNVRDKCADLKCLQAAYGARIARFNEENASFDCQAASTGAEKKICASPDLRAADLEVGKAFRAASTAVTDPDRLAEDQASWTRNVRERCTTDGCLAKALPARAGQLRAEKARQIADLAKKVGYAQRALYADVLRWPADKSRYVLAFATQASVQKTTAGEAQEGEDVLLDIYVVDTASGKVQGHLSDKLAAGGDTIDSVRVDPRDYSALLHVPSFGLSVSYAAAAACDNAYGVRVRLYSFTQEAIQPVIPELVTESVKSACRVECSGQQTYRRLRSGTGSKTAFPDLMVVEDTETDTLAGKPQECVAIGSQKTYPLHFDGKRYGVPEQLRH